MDLLYYGGNNDKECHLSNNNGENILRVFVDRKSYIPTKDSMLFTLEYGRINLDHIELEYLKSILSDTKLFKIEFLKFIEEQKQKML